MLQSAPITQLANVTGASSRGGLQALLQPRSARAGGAAGAGRRRALREQGVGWA